ncbi:MAG: diaminopimelate epimerase [Dehalococcoidia bacterium]
MRFTKLQGAGNDYIYVNGMDEDLDWSAIARRVSDRHFGIGADGLIVVKSSEQADVRMRMFNADGSEGEMCGNGIRCFAKYVLERNLAAPQGQTLHVETGAGVKAVVPHWENERIVGARVDMGDPVLSARDVPADPSKAGPSDYKQLDAGLVNSLGLAPTELMFDAPIEVEGQSFAVTAVSMGNPHATAFLETPVADLPLERIGPAVEHHAAFPRRMNFHIVNLQGRGRMTTRTWERGSGQTLACGTGASAMVVAARLHGLVDDVVVVEVPGGELTITWPGFGPVFMDGDAVEVFSGEWPD